MNLFRVCVILLAGCGPRAGTSPDTLPTDTVRPYVVSTSPRAGDTAVAPSVDRLVVTFSEPMAPGSWSWVQTDPSTYPEVTGDPVYVSATTIELPVRLEPGHDYNVGINREGKYMAFRDAAGLPAVAFDLRFSTAAE